MNSGSSGTDGDETKDALIVVASVVGLMIGLVILRFGTNILIDCCILNEPERARTDLIRILCPWYHRRTQPTSDDTPNEDEEQERAISSSVEAVPYGIRKDRLMHALSLFHLSAETIQACKINNDHRHRDHSQRMNRENNIHHQRDDEENGLPNSAAHMICSICIHELIPGDSVFKTPHCHHVFHSNCICEWMASVARKNNLECPNCRSRIMTRAALNRILLGEETELGSI